MVCLTVFYPNTPGSKFDRDYYLHNHIPLVQTRLTPVGLLGVDIDEGLAGAGPDIPPTYVMIGRLRFETLDALQAALATHGPELLGDIANFTDAQPVMQINLTV